MNKRFLSVCVFLLISLSIASATPDWLKIAADELEIDLSAPVEEYSPPNLTMLSTTEYMNLVSVLVFDSDMNVFFLICKPTGKVIFRSEAMETYVFSPDQLSFKVTGLMLGKTPGFILDLHHGSGGSGMATYERLWKLYAADKRGAYSEQIGLADLTDEVYSRYYGGSNISCWTYGGINGTRTKVEVIPTTTDYPIFAARQESFSSDDSNHKSKNPEQIQSVIYQVFTYSSQEGKYSRLTASDDPGYKLMPADTAGIALASYHMEKGHYAEAVDMYNHLINSNNEEIKNTAQLQLSNLQPSSKYNYEDIELMNKEQYKELLSRFPDSPLAPEAMFHLTDTLQNATALMELYPESDAALGSAFSILYNSYSGEAPEMNRAACDKALLLLERRLKDDPETMAFVYGMYGDFLLAAEEEVISKDDALTAKAAYEKGLAIDPQGMFTDYLTMAHARSQGYLHNNKIALEEMLAFLQSYQDSWWSSEGWNWLADNIKYPAEPEEEVVFNDGYIVHAGKSRNTYLLMNNYDYSVEDQSQNTVVIYLLDGDKLSRLLSLDGTVGDVWNANIGGKNNNDLFVTLRGAKNGYCLLFAEGKKLRKVMELGVENLGNARPDIELISTKFPFDFILHTTDHDYRFSYFAKTGQYGLE